MILQVICHWCVFRFETPHFPLERHLDRLGIKHGLCRGEGLGDDHHLEVVTKSLAGGATFKAGGTVLKTNSKFAPKKKHMLKQKKTADTKMNSIRVRPLKKTLARGDFCRLPCGAIGLFSGAFAGSFMEDISSPTPEAARPSNLGT